MMPLLRLGQHYRVTGYWTGEFIGCLEELRGVSNVRGAYPLAVLTVVDPLRPLPKVREKCPFPFCVAREFHEGEHEVCTIRPGGRIEVGLGLARFVEVAADSAALTHSTPVITPVIP
jgi:hypothetical protein